MHIRKVHWRELDNTPLSGDAEWADVDRVEFLEWQRGLAWSDLDDDPAFARFCAILRADNTDRSQCG